MRRNPYNRCMDIDFNSLDHYVTTHEALDAADFAPLKVGSETCRFVAIDAAGFGQQRLIDATDAKDTRYPTAPASLEHPHNFYQLYYDIVRNGNHLGGISIEMERGEKEAWVSAWDAKHQKGIAMGHLVIPQQNVLETLGSYVASHPAFIRAFGLAPSAEISHVIPDKAVPKGRPR